MSHSIRTGFDQEPARKAGKPGGRRVDPSVYRDVENTFIPLQNLLQVELMTLLIPTDDGQEFVQASSIGLPSEHSTGFRLSLELATATQLRPDLTPIIIEDPAAKPELSPLSQVPGVQTLEIVPLTLSGQLRGILHIGTLNRQRIENHDPELLGFAGHAVAMALDRIELRLAAEKAQEANATTRERLTFLATAGGLLSTSLDYETTLTEITEMLLPRLADVCGVVLLNTDGSVKQVTTEGVDPEVAKLVQEIQTRYSLCPGSRSMLRRVLDTGNSEFHPVLTSDFIEQTASDPEHAEMLRRLGLRSMVIVPLTGRGGIIGALSVVYTSNDRQYRTEEFEFVEELAHRAALAVENTRLFQELQRALEEREESLRFREETLLLEREARARAEAAQRREAFLSEASSVLSKSLDYKSTLDDLANLVVSRVADWCTIEVFDDSGTSSLVAAAHADPTGRKVLQRIREEYLPATIPELPPRHILRYREPTLINDLPDEFWFDSAATPEHLLHLDKLDATALIVVPFFVRDRVLGIMVLARSHNSEPFHDDDLSMSIDLGHRVALALDNSRLYSRAQSVVQQQEEFISTASHELKTPLTTVKGYLQLINRQLHREDHSPARIVRFTRELEEQVRRLEDLVSDLLDVSRIQQGRLELRLERFDLAELAARVLSRFEHAPERLPKHELTYIAREPVVGTWDPARLDQVLTNLISNALKYSPDGGQVLLRVRRVGDTAQIAVRDNGIGIKPNERANLFQPFARGRNTKPKISGTGLGLYITQRIVENHHGRIFVKSDPGQGTTFIVQLPLSFNTDVQ